MAADVRPLFVTVLAHRRVVSGRRYHSPLVTCYEVLRAFSLLGYRAGLLEVDVTVVDLDRGGKRIASVGGHVVVDATSFNRIVDPALFLRREIRRAVGPATPTTPVVFPRTEALRRPGNAVARPPHAMLYDFAPGSLSADMIERGDALLEAERNALLTASQALSIILALWNLDSSRIGLNPLLQGYADRGPE
ncbi:hypothetical protein [Catenuloplanes atrovinosus]|uniref:Uncharacterized protein n=1 Tax=Catenuloplanes atrovinosus TaxID=137266 RepID=A0AAE4C7B1_9ACTN|nr:hypothetical protein [Catenuloplanes atrovinosus]MDR7273673.1 hypothetical protein [Catenuloplanes atrovinosus]